MYTTQESSEIKKTPSNNPSTDLKPSIIPRPSSNLSERITKNYGRQYILSAKGSSPVTKEERNILLI